YMLEGTAGECEPQAIGRIVAKMVADGPLIRHSGIESRKKQGRRRFWGGRFLFTRALRSHAAFAPYTSVTAILHSLCSRCTATPRSPSTLKVMVLQHRGHNQKYWKWRNVPAYSKPFSSPDLGTPKPGPTKKSAPSCRYMNESQTSAEGIEPSTYC